MFELPNKLKWIAAATSLVGLVLLVLAFQAKPSHAADEHNAHDTHAVAHDDHGHDAHAESHDDHDDHDAHAAHGDAHGDDHDSHGGNSHLAENRPWAAFLVSSIFFLSFGIGALFFLAIQYVAQVGWSAGLLRVMEAMALWVGVPILGILFIVIAGGMDMHHLYHFWVEGIDVPGHANYDKLVAGKMGYLNFEFFLTRTIAYLVIWAGAAYLLRRNSLREDAMPKGENMFFTQRKLAAIFVVLYAVTSSTSAWDWIMSIDTHWFSTLFGWYTFAGMFVTAMTGMNLIVIFLRLGGHLPWINANHQHDLGKFVFAFSIFWTYLWFSQYMLIWYSNIPEEVTYYLPRFFGEYKPLFLTMVVLNFVLPILVLMSRDSKRILGFLALASVFILAGHYIDHYVMIMPGTVGNEFGFGMAEIGGILFYLGLFILVVGRNLSKAPLRMANHAMNTESELFHQ